METTMIDSTCHTCGQPTGPQPFPQACQTCHDEALAVFWAVWDQPHGYPLLDPDTWQPVPGHVVKCGNRTDLFKKQRVHWLLDAGEATVHNMDGTYEQLRALICARCGTTKYTTMEAA